MKITLALLSITYWFCVGTIGLTVGTGFAYSVQTPKYLPLYLISIAIDAWVLGRLNTWITTLSETPKLT